MSEQHDPPRWKNADETSGGAFAEIARGLHDARGVGPSAEQHARLRAALGLPPEPGAGGSPLGMRGTWFKVTILAALALGAAIGLLRLRETEPKQEARAVEPAANEPTPPQSAGSRERPLIAEPPDEAEPVAPQMAKPDGRAQRSATVRPPRRATEPAHDAGAELALLKRAKAHARSAPAHALALCAEHEQRFADGLLAQEREVIAIEALLVAGQRDAGERRAQQFLARYAGSAHARRVRALLAEDEGDSDTKPVSPAHARP